MPPRKRSSALPTGTVTFLFTDVEGSTRSWIRSPDAMRPALVRHDALIESLVAEHGGHVVRPRGEGDSRFAVFSRASDGVAAACAIQLAFGRERWPLPEPLRVRMALHTGDADLHIGDYYGPAVNHCARLRGVAHGTQVLISAVTADLVREALPMEVTMRDLGQHQLKDLEQPERVWQLVHPNLPSEFPPLASLSHAHRKLPVQLTSFVGRDLRELRDLLASTRLLTLTGPGGIGKTRLAQEVGRHVEADYGDGSVFVDLAPVADPTLVPQAMARVLGVREERDKPLMETVQDHLGSQQLLVVLDNCEHLLDGSARLADALVRNCPRLRILATSREAIRIDGETAWAVPPLRPDAACQLFVERAHAAQATLDFTDEDVSVIAGICQHLDGIPLAIELAAARVHALGLEQIVDRLEERLRLLSGGSRLAPARHQTLRAAVDWSYELLSDQERRVFEQLSVFSGGWSLEAATAVCALESLEPRDVLEVIAGLVDKSLVVAEERGGHMRYCFLETIREYASERLEASNQAREVRRRHAAHYRQLAEAGSRTASIIGVRHPHDVDVVTQEHDNLRAALSAMLALGDLDAGLGLCQALGGFWLSQGYLNEGETWLARFLVHAEVVPWETLAASLHTAGRLAEYRGAYDRARNFHERSLCVSRQHDNATHAARALGGLGAVAIHQGEYGQAVTCYQEALSLGRRAEESLPEVAQALLALAQVADLRGEAAHSRELREESLRIHRRLEDQWGIAYVLNGLGQQARREGQLEQAQAMHEESHRLWRQWGSRMGERSALMNLAVVALELGELVRSAALAHESLVMSQELADASASTVRCVEIASEVLHVFGDLEMAVRLVAAATVRREALGAPVPPSEQAERERTLSGTRAALAVATFEQVWKDGGRLAIHEAVALATASLKPLGESVSPVAPPRP